MNKLLKKIYAVGLITGLYFCLSFHFGSDLQLKSYFQYRPPKVDFLRELKLHPDYKSTGLNFQPKHPGIIPYNTTVLQKLKTLYPYDSAQPIPKQIFKMWKVGLDDPEFPQHFREYHQTWLDNSPDYTHRVMSNDERDALVLKLYADIPEITHAYKIMPKTMNRCDFSSYLLLYALGGIYADIDTKLLKPISSWIPSQSSYLGKSLDLGLIVGIESDYHKGNWARFFARRLQIEAWTFLAKKGHPMLAEIIDNITEYTYWREETGKLAEVLGKDEAADVLNWAGPGRLTDLVFKYLNNILQTDFDSYEKLIDDEFLIGIKLPVVIFDAMVLPLTCMQPGEHSRILQSGNLDDPLAYIHHISAGSWRKHNKGKSIYVE
ncbi:mannosyltransferase [Spathaspora passalidarum NRRL Y-27907]|uniref:Mannosyltransferase n=1 Tax=Spathaspora passalidarum (strain NRRL Y-27907 / 11-Y1) TaxID=619300 RepID=G3AG38_SPAPN|nr:mannosyltransferase [Spathaspora passalidarum NRRL Y-27907]EGW35177.1 mannosyltransferase [Spathaspora passalidarum NRRL Y-27907]